MRRFLLLVSFTLFFSTLFSYSQEMNIKITVNSDRVSGTDKAKFSALETALSQLVNGRKWTDATFLANEKIEGSMLITVNSVQEHTFDAEIQVISNRPVFNSSYNTPMFNFKDNEFEFEYVQGQNIEFTENNVDNNLTATIAFYVYIILGLDYDSFALNAGKPYFEKAMSVVTSAQMLNRKGWAAFENDRNRYALALALTDETSSIFHALWYNYHRKGLDEMVNNATRGRTEIENTIPELQKIYRTRPTSALLLFFADTKLNEVVSVYSESTQEEKQQAVKTLTSIYPSKRYIIDTILKK